LMTGHSLELWKWHRWFGHLSFDLLARLSYLNF
jgi:hypothetical protein